MHILPQQRCLARLDRDKKATVTVLQAGAHVPGFFTCIDAHGNLINVHYQNLMPIENIPLRYRRASFERYAHVIGAALRAYPGCVVVDPRPMTPESYAQPLRYAIHAKQKFGYKHPDIDEEMFARDGGKVKVHITESGLFVGGERPSTQDKRIAGRVLEAGCNEEQDVLVDASALETLCDLLTKRALSPVPAFVVAGLDDAAIASYEARYDVAFVPHESLVGRHRLVPPFSIQL